MVGMTGFDEAQHPRATGGQFAVKRNDAPAETLAPAGPACTECDGPAVYRLGNIPNGYRTPSDPVYCEVHAAAVAADGRSIEALPEPQQPGEVIVWLVEGDDHEYVKVEAATEDEALDLAADSFDNRYDDDDDDDENDVRDLLVIAGTFRGDVYGYSDEMEFVPYGDIDENTAFGKLQHA